tara:strand:- start:232 stop:1653 length:1422 start_codon:yes stop_codon:yes gene_type:complete
MAFFPPQDNTQDVSGIPANDAMAQLELKRKLRIAEALQNAKAPEGQMISGHYVAPSFTQSLANAYGMYKGKKSEEEAIKKYGEYTAGKEQKMAEALKKLGGAFEPRTVTNTTMQATDVPLTEGMNVGTSPFGTVDQVSQVAPKFGMDTPAPQNMAGTTTQMNPVTSTSTVQPTTSDIEKAFGEYASEVRDPKLLASILTGKYEQMRKAQEPVKLGAGEAVYSPTGTKIFGNPKEGAKYTNIQQDKAGNSFGFNTETNQFEQLPGAKMATQNWSAPYKVGGEFVQRDNNTGEIRKAYGTADGDKAPAGYTYSADASGQKILKAIPGGPADKALNPTKEQSDAYTYSNRMESSDKILTDLEGKYSPLAVSVKVSGKTALIPGGQTIVNKMLDPNDQKAEQAQRNFINAVLRRESGATIQPYEFDNANMQYFPQEGDSQEVLVQKRANRREAIEGLKKAAGSMNKSTGVVNFEDLK